MKLAEIKSIIKDFEASSLTILELEADSVKLKLSKNKDQQFEEKVYIQNEEAKQSIDLNTTKNIEKLPTAAIKSPLVGTFYESSTPHGKAFVKVGDKVKKGQVVCIVEAMKIMNEITSPIEGVIDRVLFKNGDVVGFDDALFVVV